MAWGTPTSLGAFVQQNTGGHSLVYSSITVAQNSLIVITGGMRANTGADTIVVSDSAGNNYTVAQHTRAGTTTIGFIAWAVASTALSAGTITVADTSTGTTNFTACAFQGFSVTGENTGTPNDSAATASNDAAATTTPTVTSGVPSASGELFFAVYMASVANNNTYTEDATNGWTNAMLKAGSTGGTIMTASSAYQVNAGSSAVTHAPTTSSASYTQTIVAFQLSSNVIAASSTFSMMGV